MDKNSKNALVSLRAAMGKFDYIAARRACQALEENAISCRMEPNELKKCIVGMLESMMSESYELEEALAFYNMSGGMDAIQNLKDATTCQQFFTLLNEVIKNLINTLIDIEKNIGKTSIERVKKYIAEHYNEDISLKKLSEYVHLNQNYLSELFKGTTGTNYITYLTDTRIAMAKKLLLDPNAKVYEVAEKVGYAEHVSFNKAFRKVVGVSPAVYRKSLY